MTDDLTIASGCYVRVRDEDWLVTDVEQAGNGSPLVYCTGVSALVAGETAQFLAELDEITVLRPESTQFIDDTSRNYTQSRLFLEAVMRRADLPRSEPGLALADGFLLDAFAHQQRPAQMALENLRPRLLIADVVGLGKTLEIGLLLAELIRRGRGKRILVVVPQQILDQFQREMWTRFSIPLLRMDSEGIARVQQQLPAGRNPFEFHQRIIISVDTLKSDRYHQYLQKVSWDAVVFDESHNLIGGSGGNSRRKRLATLVADTTEALIFASATPHPGKNRAFADLIDMLDPTRIVDRDNYSAADIEGLFIRRTKNDPEVKQGLASRTKASWAPRGDATRFEAPASDAEEAVFSELADTWLRPQHIGQASRHLFAYTLLKSFFSSPAALIQTITEREKQKKSEETEPLKRLRQLAERIVRPAKLTALLDHLRAIGIGKDSTERVVIFSERHQTLDWLQTEICAAFGMDDQQVMTLRGTTPDKDAAEIIEAFSLGDARLRVLITGDIASEGVNLHRQCHQLVHWDIPWSLIRIEQRNGRIDRYGQKRSPQFSAMMLRSSQAHDWDESRVAGALLRKEQSANAALGSVEADLGHNDAGLEEDRLVRDILAEKKDPEAALSEPEHRDGDLSHLFNGNVNPVAETPPPLKATLPRLFDNTSGFVNAALSAPAIRGEQLMVETTDDNDLKLTELPDDLLQRITRILPPRYIKDQSLTEQMFLTTDKKRAQQSLDRAQEKGTSAWPDKSYLSDLHPVVEWLTDRAILAMGRGRAPIIYADVPSPVYGIEGIYTNGLRQSAVVEWMAVTGVDTRQTQVDDLVPVLRAHGVNERMQNRGRVTDSDTLDSLKVDLVPALEAARVYLDYAKDAWSKQIRTHLDASQDRIGLWEQGVLTGLEQLEVRRKSDEARARDTAAAQRRSIEALDVVGEPLLRVVVVLLPTNK